MTTTGSTDPTAYPATTERKSVLLVDDERVIQDSLSAFLQRSGYNVYVADNGHVALDMLGQHSVDIIVSDVMMPNMDGRELVRQIRQQDIWIPIILLTKVGQAGERSSALDEGADYYLNKPFEPQELLSRIRAVLRRHDHGQQSLQQSTTLDAGALRLDKQARRVWLGEQEITLTPRAFSLLAYLMAHPGEVHSRERLLQVLWGFDFPVHTRAIDHRIAELRKKLGDESQNPTYIETVSGFGYRFCERVTS